jgi:NADH-quinone oxidoreductase subunit H
MSARVARNRCAMTDAHLVPWVAPVAAGIILCVGAYVVAVVDELVGARTSGVPMRPSDIIASPGRSIARELLRQQVGTEHPDVLLARLAPALLFALAALGLSIVPLSATVSIADLPTGIVVWGAVEALTIILMFTAGWSSNSMQPMIAGYRYVAIGFSVLLLSMFALIAVAVHAGSLNVRAIVDDQAGLWNVVRQPLGLPLFVIVALGITSWGPMNLASGSDLGGGITAEWSGAQYALWALSRRSLLVSFAAMSAAVFLGGWHGPWVPGAVWMAVKTVTMLVVFVALGHRLARVSAERMLSLCWVVLLPVAFLDLAIAGLESL